MKNLVLIVFVLISTVGFSQDKKADRLKQHVSEIQESLELDDETAALLYDAMKERNVDLMKIKKEAEIEGLDKEALKEKKKPVIKEFRKTLTEILGEEDQKKLKAFYKEKAAKKKAAKNN